MKFNQWWGHSKPNATPTAKSFGVSLLDAPRMDGSKVPMVLEKMINHLRECALETEGLFRISGSLTAINELIKALDAGQEINLNNQDQHTVAGLLKRYFRDLPDPLIPVAINQNIASIFGGDIRKPMEEGIYDMREALYTLPEVHFETLKTLMGLLADLIKHSDRNKMTLSNIAICIVPSLDCVPVIVTYTLQNYDFFFKDPQPYKEQEQDVIPETESAPITTTEKQVPLASNTNEVVSDSITNAPVQPLAVSLSGSEEKQERRHKDRHKDKKRAHHKRHRDEGDYRSHKYDKEIIELQGEIAREKEKYEYYSNKTAELEHKLKKEEDYSRTLQSDYEQLEHKLRKVREEYNSPTTYNASEHNHRSAPKTPRS